MKERWNTQTNRCDNVIDWYEFPFKPKILNLCSNGKKWKCIESADNVRYYDFQITWAASKSETWQTIASVSIVCYIFSSGI